MAAEGRSSREGDNADSTQSPDDLIAAKDDVEALVVSTMMEAATDARADVRAIMAGVKSINSAKRQLRELLGRINRDVVAATVSELEGNAIAFSPAGLGGEGAYRRVEIPVPDAEARGGVQVAVIALVDRDIISRSQLTAAADAIKNDLDSLSELGEMESLRLQMAMDRLTKLMTALSNLLKKLSDTSEVIIANLK
jgi:hypothetical protein